MRVRVFWADSLDRATLMFHNCGFRRNLVIMGATYTKTIRRFNRGAEVEAEAGALQTDASSGYNWYHMERKKAQFVSLHTRK